MTEAAFRGRKDIPAPTRSGDLLAHMYSTVHSDMALDPTSRFAFDDMKKRSALESRLGRRGMMDRNHASSLWDCAHYQWLWQPAGRLSS